MLVSILMPFLTRQTAGPAPALLAALQALAAQPGPLEVVVAASVPTRRADWTVALRAALGAAWPHTLRLLHNGYDERRPPWGRGAAINAAAAAAVGEALLVLHADCRLPADGLAAVRQALAAGALWGCFRKHYQPQPRLLAWQAVWLNLGDLRRGRPVGTNAVWVRREAWAKLPDWRLFEDFALADRLRRLGPCRVLRSAVAVDAAKYLRTGPLRAVLLNGLVVTFFRLGLAAPDQLAEHLYSRRHLPAGAAWWPALLRQTGRCLLARRQPGDWSR
ncbi:MAG: hypothetical protein IT204_25195 [Fimbriimonadaceae bacterium]|nr:hypothetical protein [Fimbriimonadaceae bacterium]